MEQKNYWNDVAEAKTFTTPFQSKEFERYVSKSSIIVDVGCGYGRTLNELSALGYENLTGFDFSEEMIKRGKVTFPQLNLNTMSDGHIPADDNSVDAVILFAVLTCISSNDGQEALIKEICRVLKKDGIIYVNDFLLNEDDRNLERYEKHRKKYGVYGVFELPEGAVLRHHSEEWIDTLLSGFKRLEFEHLTFTTMNGNKSNGFYYIGRKTEYDPTKQDGFQIPTFGIDNDCKENCTPDIQPRKYFLKTDRCGFSHWAKGDMPLAASLWGESEVTRYICASGVFSAKEIENRLHTEIYNFEKFGVQYFPFYSLESGELIGCCGLRPYKDGKKVYELGFHLRKEHWHKGYATEAAAAIISYAFDTLGATELKAGHNPNNIASGRVLSKLGFRYECDEFYEPTGLNHPLYSLRPEK